MHVEHVGREESAEVFGRIARANLVGRVPDMPRLLPQIWNAARANLFEN